MNPGYAEILRLFEAQHAACDVHRAGRTPAARSAFRAADSRLRAAQAAARDAFAVEHRVIYPARSFTLDQLSRNSNQWGRNDDYVRQRWPMDHVEYSRLAMRGQPPGAIIAHQYDPFESGNAVALAREYGLTAILLPWSWYWPGHAHAVLYMGLDILCL